MGNNSSDSYDRSHDPAKIKHESYSVGISKGPTYIEGSIEKGEKGKLEPSINAGVNASLSASTPTHKSFYREKGVNKEISIGFGGVEKSTNYYKSSGVSIPIKYGADAYIEKTTYVKKDDLDKYNQRVKDYGEIKENKIYKHNKSVRDEVNYEYSDCIHPYDYKKDLE